MWQLLQSSPGASIPLVWHFSQRNVVCVPDSGKGWPSRFAQDFRVWQRRQVPRSGCGGLWQVSQPERGCLKVEGLKCVGTWHFAHSVMGTDAWRFAWQPTQPEAKPIACGVDRVWHFSQRSA